MISSGCRRKAYRAPLVYCDRSPFHTAIFASRLIRRSYKAKREVKSNKDDYEVEADLPFG
jgi:hypothetical protein